MTVSDSSTIDPNERGAKQLNLDGVGRIVAQILANELDGRFRRISTFGVCANQVNLTLADGRVFVIDITEDDS